MSRGKRNSREFARVEVRLGARFRIVRGEEAEALQQELAEGPSVWGPVGESELMKLAASTSPGHEGLLAQAVLDLSRQVSRLNYRAFIATGPTAVGDLVQLSGGGGQIATEASLPPGTRLDLRLADDDVEAPPIRILAEVIRGRDRPHGPFPLKFTAIHPTDRERLIQFIHSLQRRLLRQTRQRA